MSLVTLVVTLVVVGLVLWGVSQLPIDATVMRIIRAVVIIAVVFWLVSIFFGPLPNIRVR